MSRHEAWFIAGEIGAALAGQQLTVNSKITNQHRQPLIEGFADNFSVLHIFAINE